MTSIKNDEYFTKINEDNPFFSLNYLGTTKIDSLDEWNNGSY